MADVTATTPPTPQDRLLEGWVRATERGTMNFGVTLQVSGVLVSGILISTGDYLKRFGAAFRDGAAKDEKSAKAGEVIFNQLVEAADQRQHKIDADTESEKLTPLDFIHLADARLYATQSAWPAEFPFWRGRLASVDGWMFGQMQPKTN